MRKRLRAYRVLLGFGFRADRGEFVVLFTAAALGQLALLASAYGVKLVADGVLRRSLAAVFVAAVLIAVARELTWLLDGVRLSLSVKIQEKASQLLNAHLVALTASIPTIEHHERPDYLKDLDLLRQQGQLLGALTNMTVINFRTAVAMIGGAILLSRLHPALLLLPLCGLGALWTGWMATKIYETAREANAERWRLCEHLRGLATSAGPAKELRVFGLQDELIRRYHTAASLRIRADTIATWKAEGLQTLSSLLFGVGYIGAIALVLRQALAGDATAGDVLLAISLAAQMQGTIAEAVVWGNYMGEVLRAARRFLWLEDYAWQARPVVAEPMPVPDRLTSGIALDHVSFRYPETDQLILDDVSLVLPAGKMVALVGENGAGKTSLVKLLCRFYAPVGGRIVVDGTDVERFHHEAWRARLGVGFQDFSRFECLAGEAVGLGDVPRLHDAPAVELAVERGGARDVIDALPAGLAAQLGKTWPGGVELSGGQWQKLALARASMRPVPLLLILDEPTAAIDAPTEYALFERFGEAARRGETHGAITVVVSHRFSTVRMADLIVVLDKGRVLEAGSHEELMHRQGLYAELFELQAKAYR